MNAARIAMAVTGLCLIATTPASATLMSITATYNQVQSGTATLTGIYDDTGLTGSGQEIFTFLQVSLVFSPGGSFLAGTTHMHNDMFGVLFVNGVPNDIVNYNNVGLFIFDTADSGYPGAMRIYMDDNSSAMLLEPFFITNHQGASAQTLAGFSTPVAVPEPALAVLLTVGLACVRSRAR